MHMSPDEAQAFLDAFLRRQAPSAAAEPAPARLPVRNRGRVEFLSRLLPPEILLFPPFTSLAACAERLENTGIAVGAQNAHPEPRGAFTGEVSCEMITACGARYLLVGHSERRHLFGDTEEMVRRKLAAARRTGLVPVLCVGETAEERSRGETRARLVAQLRDALSDDSPEEVAELVVAYEPIWAIGTGKTATPDDAEDGCCTLRVALEKRLGKGAAESVRVLYGGSVNPENASELLSQPNIDGALVGGASLDPERFAAIVDAASNAA